MTIIILCYLNITFLFIYLFAIITLKTVDSSKFNDIVNKDITKWI